MKNTIMTVAIGLKEIGNDADGKAAVAAKIKKIHLIAGTFSLWEKAITVSGGVLTVTVSTETNMGLSESTMVNIVTKQL